MPSPVTVLAMAGQKGGKVFYGRFFSCSASAMTGSGEKLCAKNPKEQR